MQHGSLWSLVEWRAGASPDALFAVDEADRRLTFAEYRDAAERCAAGLAAQGAGAGTPVSWMLPTWLETLVVCAALARLGAVQNPILPIYRDREARFVTRQTGARLLVVPGSFRSFDYAAMGARLAAEHAERGQTMGVVVIDPSIPDGDPGSLPPPPAATVADAAPVRWVFYTSGTTADPKGALHTDHTIGVAGESLVRVLDLREDDRIAMVFPITHIGGAGWLLASLLSGCAHIVVPIFDPKTSIPALARHGVTQAAAGTAFHQAYLEAQRAQPGTRLFARVRSFPGGGAPRPPELHGHVRRELGGVGVVSGYGLTECPIIAMASVHDPDEKLAGTEGRANPPPPAMQLKIVKQDGALAAPGEEGEIRAKGPQLCRGYLDASLDAAAFDEEGSFKTGDLGRLDADGYLTITGRLKDVIIRKGENISAKEIEDLLSVHPKVADVAVIGLPDPGSGERACAVVAPKDAGDPLSFEEMSAFLRTRQLMLQKIPEQLELVDALPRNATGKVLKHELRARFGKPR